ncbi:MAG: hypothetical protein J7L43_01255 [Candidatus Aenigmarchaeota archaeon]|nr:hypothetical protein [Candidatus Aenigmarchaeota archaeon]
MIDSKKLELILQELIRRANRGDRRLRELEQRTQALESRVSSLEDSLFKQTKELKKRIIDLSIDIKSISEQVNKIEENIARLNDQAKNFARRKELKELENMFELLNPIQQEFVTKEEVRKMIREYME